MTRMLALAAAMLLTTSAGAAPKADTLTNAFGPMPTEIQPLDPSTFLTAEMSFADAMRMISTITLPEMPGGAAISSGPTIRVRTVTPTIPVKVSQVD